MTPNRQACLAQGITQTAGAINLFIPDKHQLALVFKQAFLLHLQGLDITRCLPGIISAGADFE